MKKRKSFSLIELIILIGFLIILGGGGVISFSNIKASQTLRIVSEELGTNLKKSHIFAQQGRESSDWGVRYKDANSYELIAGSIAAPVVKSLVTLDKPVSFSSDWGQIWFKNGEGTTEAEKNIDLQCKGTKLYNSRVVVRKMGVVDINFDI